MNTLYKNIIIFCIIAAPVVWLALKFNALKNEIDVKNKEIVELRAVIDTKNDEIAQLNSKLSIQNSAIKQLAEENKVIQAKKDSAYIKIEQMKKDNVAKIQLLQDRKVVSDACLDANKLFDEFNK